MCDGLRMLLLPLVALTWPVARLDAAAPRLLEETLQHIPKLSHAQVALIADNATARCELMPQLCDWQLHLYDGHAFSVQLPQRDSSKSNNAASSTSTSSTSSTTTTTSSPLLENEPTPVIFAVPSSDQGHKLLIYAQVERQQSWTKLGKSQQQRQRQRRRRQRRRRRKLLANFKMLE
ncbi:hypothetical protein KR093_006361 [Drosophila rubida]|uniref:Uncharacterized protein n=1 Tax=Drosophila rubida TaxID=30044 RepID=A0AAD4K073_9MUSC|nr:hypothetical protein KR093_006361 [Drosophila rubida]